MPSQLLGTGLYLHWEAPLYPVDKLPSSRLSGPQGFHGFDITEYCICDQGWNDGDIVLQDHCKEAVLQKKFSFHRNCP